MQTEDIQKAADKHSFEYLCKDNIDMLELGCHYEAGFMAGAEWRINTVWHERTEPAEEGNDIILLFPDGKCTVMTLNGEWELIIAWLLFYKWAYLKDILPDNFVKTK